MLAWFVLKGDSVPFERMWLCWGSLGEYQEAAAESGASGASGASKTEQALACPALVSCAAVLRTASHPPTLPLFMIV